MNRFPAMAEVCARLHWRLKSVPIGVKILGIVVAVALLFAGLILPEARQTMVRVHYRALEHKALAVGQSLAADVERPLITADSLTVDERIKEAKKAEPDIRYVIVRDRENRLVAHTFPDGVPPDLLKNGHENGVPEGRVEVLGCDEGLIFDTSVPILGGRAGVVQVGLSDRGVREEIGMVTRSLAWGLLLCACIGTGLALLLTGLLTRPIRRLVSAARRIQDGDFQARAEAGSADEMGRLASAFNQMAESLERYRRDVREKERARLSLIRRIVQVQEEERKRTSRELHDEVGQSLSALLLAVQSGHGEGDHGKDFHTDLECRLTQLIEEVHRLAWGMRPSILDDFGLNAALSRLVQDASAHSRTRIDYEHTAHAGAGRLPDQIETTLYRLAQEAVTNIERHAQANHASVVVLQSPREVTLLVEDDGKGFDVRTAERNIDTCLGITGMKERVALLDGTFAIESEPKRGTTIRVTIPHNGGPVCLSES